MTPEMTFECLLVCHDPVVFGNVDRILRAFSISTRLCLSSSKATSELTNGTDLIVIDWDETSANFLHEVWRSGRKQKPTILAISQQTLSIPGVHIVLHKPITPESGTKALRAAYSRMLQDHRRRTRYAVMMPVVASDESGRTLRVTVTDINVAGVGLKTREQLAIGDVLHLPLLLPGCRKSISLQIRVLWTREYGVAGCEFLRVPPVDLDVLHDWLEGKNRVRKPLVGL